MPTVNDIIVKRPSDSEAETCKGWPIWSCEVSEFDWSYDQTETCLVLEGEVTVTDTKDGTVSVTFGPGDMVTFPRGLSCYWNVTQPIRKHYTFS